MSPVLRSPPPIARITIVALHEGLGKPLRTLSVDNAGTSIVRATVRAVDHVALHQVEELLVGALV
eukprot:341540-Hanusia_phi.AAC.1